MRAGTIPERFANVIGFVAGSPARPSDCARADTALERLAASPWLRSDPAAVEALAALLATGNRRALLTFMRAAAPIPPVTP